MDPRELQSRLLAWERALGIVEPEGWGPRDVDGKIGPRSRAALACYQRLAEWCGHRGVQRHDGVLDAATEAALRQDTPNWTAADAGAVDSGGGMSFADAAKRAAAALDVVAPWLTPAGKQVVLAIGYFESGWGMLGGGFKGFLGSNNWGARQGKGDLGTIDHADMKGDGTPYVTGFSKYSTPEMGARGLVDGTVAWSNPTFSKQTRAAANAGDAGATALWMYRGGYYDIGPKAGYVLWSPEDHARRVNYYAGREGGGIRGAAAQVAAALGQPALVQLGTEAVPSMFTNGPNGRWNKGGPSGTGGGGLAALALAVGLAKLGGLF